MGMSTTVRVNYILPRKLIEAVRRLADAEQRTMTEIVRRALERETADTRGRHHGSKDKEGTS